MAHFELFSFLASATGLLALISFCLLVFGRLGVGSIVAFLIAGLVVGQMRDLPPASVHALQEFAELGVILLLFLIGLFDARDPFPSPIGGALDALGSRIPGPFLIRVEPGA